MKRKELSPLSAAIVGLQVAERNISETRGVRRRVSSEDFFLQTPKKPSEKLEKLVGPRPGS